MASNTRQLYFCHQCSRPVELPSPGQLVCPNCNGEFLEEYSGPGPNTPGVSILPGIELNPWSVHPGLNNLLDLSSFITHLNMAHGSDASSGGLGGIGGGGLGLGSGGGGGGVGVRLRVGHDPANSIAPILILRNQIQQLLNMRNAAAMAENGTDGASAPGPVPIPGPRPLPLPGSFGDYFFGPSLDFLIQQLAENDPNRYGTPPAAKSAIDALPTIKISNEHLKSDATQCAVCKDEFEKDTEVKQMPCKHMYHKDCILPWLAQHNSCPVCRFELPTDDPDYENGNGRSSRGSSSNQNSGGPGGFSIQGIPRQFLIGRINPDPNSTSQSQQQQQQPHETPVYGPSRGREGGGRPRFSFTLRPLFRAFTNTSQSTANMQAGTTSQSNSPETLSSTPMGNDNNDPSRNSFDDGDTMLFERRREHLD